MRLQLAPRRVLLTLVLALACFVAAFAGCSSGDGGGAASNEGVGGGPPRPDAGASGGPNDGGSIFNPDAFGDGAPQTLLVDPPSVTLTVGSKTVPATQTFVAKLGSGGSAVQATWTLDKYDLGDVDQAGLFFTTGIVGGVAKVIATYGSQKATATVTVNVKISEDILDDPSDPGPTPGNKGLLTGPVTPDPGPAVSSVLYPYDQTVFPRDIRAPVVQFSPGTLPPEDVKLTLRGTYFEWTGFHKVKNAARPRVAPPQDVWDAAILSASGSTLDLEVVKASGGTAYGTAKVLLKAAPGSLKGAVYYMTYEAPHTGLWAVKPGSPEPAKQIATGCVVCHSVSANGKSLSTGAEVNQPNPQTGVYRVNGDLSISKLTGAPAGLGGDTRGISFGVFTPDGKYVTRSQNNFWGGPNLMAWKIDDVTPALAPATVVGAGADVSALLPAFSPDGKRYAFTTGGAPGQPGTPSRSIGVMDVTIDEATGPNGTLTFQNLKVVLDNGPSGATAKYVTFLPDSNLIVLQEGQAKYPEYSGMLPSWDGNAYGTQPNKLHLIDIASSGHVELAHANKGHTAFDEVHNYEPFALPQPAAGFFWVVFTSIRQYGNTHLPGEERKQLWVTAITPGAAPGTDPSHPPFFLPNQTGSKNERGFWALEPCESDGAGCEVDADCCRGYCRASNPSDPNSVKTCEPVESECVPRDESCVIDADCCEADTGVKCVAGFCSLPVPK